MLEAMSPIFDDFYASRTKFAFTYCDEKYIPEQNEVGDADILLELRRTGHERMAPL